ncbi:MAG: hypothetical protein H0T62_04610 [Parachlamydiaceae bacterium]|nr:hypothetical protein [Parachlamydiaceae bacterium]
MNFALCCSSNDQPTMQQLAQDKILKTRNNFGAFTAKPLIQEIDDYSMTGGIDKKVLATAATAEKLYNECPTFTDPMTITPYRTIHLAPINEADALSEEVEIIANQISPTCLRTLKDEDSTNLENIYVASDGEEFISGRAGIIDTRKKSQQFHILVDQHLALLPIKDRVARVVSHQLNSPETEGKMIENQHREMARLNSENKAYKVAHLNTPTNVLYDYTMYIRKIPYIGKFLSALIEGIFLYGEKESKKQNIEGLARMAIWLKEDLEDFELNLDGMGESLDFLDLSIISNSKKDIETTRSLTKISLLRYYDDLSSLNQQLQSQIDEGGWDNLKPVQEKIALMKMILGDQLDIEGQELDRGCLNMAIELLNSRLGVLGFINCKSGLDRTGYLFAVKTAMAEMEKVGANLFEMVTQWSSLTSALNKISYIVAENFENDKDEFVQSVWIGPIINNDLEINNQVVEFRMKVFENLRTHGLDATARSTGVFGFKWGTGSWAANRIPLNFLPPLVTMIDTDNHEIEVPLVKYNEGGIPTGLTPEGQAFLIKDSQMRGA